MGYGDQFLVKPGTLLLIAMIAAVGMGVFNWASTSIGETGNKSLDRQDNTLKCANFDIHIQEVKENDTHVEVLFKPTLTTEAVHIHFEGEKNVTKTVRNVKESSIETATADIANLSKIKMKGEECTKTIERSTFY